MKNVITFIFIAIAFVLIIIFINNRDKKVIHSTNLYEDCIMEQYEMTPTAYYLLYGDYPRCITNNNK